MKKTLPVEKAMRFLDRSFAGLYPEFYFEMPGWIFIYKGKASLIQYEIHHRNAWVNGNLVNKLKKISGLHHQQAKCLLRQKVNQYTGIFPKSILEGWYHLPARLESRGNGTGVIVYDPIDRIGHFRIQDF